MKKMLLILLFSISFFCACANVAFMSPDVSVDQPSSLEDKPSEIDYAK